MSEEGSTIIPARPAALLFGVPIDDVTMPEAIETIAELVRIGRSTGRTHQVATVNVDFLVNALADAKLHRILRHSDLNLADGMPLLWAAQFCGTPLRERVAGADLVPELAAQAAGRGWRIHLFGATDGVAEHACEVLRERHPGAALTAWGGPLLTDVEHVDDEVLARIAAKHADILCVALGNPKQERFIEANRDRLGIPVMIGIGGSLDMLVGHKRRAPKWAQRFGMEWAFRAAQEPLRLGRRYAHDAVVFFPRLTTEVVRAWRTRRGATLDRWASDAQRLSDGQPVVVDLSGIERLSRQGTAQLVDLSRRARRAQTAFRAQGCSPMLGDRLALDRAEAPSNAAD